MKNVRQLFDEFKGGIWITSDFATKDYTNFVSAERKRLRQIVSGLTERTLYDSAFDTEEQMNASFKEFGFSAEVIYQTDEVPWVSCIQRLNLPPQILKRARSKLKLWLLRPA
jgi:hypothetical protein